MSAGVYDQLVATVGTGRVVADAPLAPMTTFKVGGAADFLVEPRTAAELRGVLEVAREHALPVTVLGGGSNLLVGDRGVRGVVVRPRGGEMRLVEGRVRADAAVTINGLVRWTVSHALAGVESWAGTPGTVGGAVHGNAHFKGQNIGSLIARAGLITRDGSILEVPGGEMEFGYDRSRLQRTGEILLWADFEVRPGDADTLRQAARQSLAYRKRTQPLHLPSAGCIFQNPDPAVDSIPPGLPASAGALIDRAGLKGRRIGGARVSESHANFIVNDGGATAADIRRLIDECREVVRREHGVDLREEIVCLGEF